MNIFKKILIKHFKVPVKIYKVSSKKDKKTEMIGYAGAFLSTVYMIPQVIQVMNTGSTKDVSLGFISLFMINSVVWLLYGIRIRSIPFVITDSFHLASAVIILYYKLNA